MPTLKLLRDLFPGILCLGLSLGYSLAEAQQVWSFEQVMEQALATHPSIQSRRSSSSAARADLDAANWQRYPTPSLESSRDKNGTTSLLRIQQPLWAGGRITSGIDAARFRHDAADAAIIETKEDIVFRVIAAYVEAIRQVLREDAAKKSLKQHEDLLGMITRRVKREASPSVDMDLARSRLYQAANNYSSAKQALATALTQLSQLTGQPVQQISTSLDAEGAHIAPTLQEAIDAAIFRSPTLKRLTLEEGAAAADIDSKKAAYMPQLALRYEKSYGPLADQRVMLVLEAQPGAGLSAAAGVESATARRDAARLDREVALRELRQRVSIDWDEWVTARTRLDNAALASTSSKEVYESYTRQYTAGRKSWLDVMNAVLEATQSEFAVADVQAEVTGAALRLRLQTGSLHLNLETVN